LTATLIHHGFSQSVIPYRWPAAEYPAGTSLRPLITAKSLAILLSEINLKRLLSASSLIVFALVVFALAAAASAGAQDFKGFYVGGYAGGASTRTGAHTTTIFSATGYFATTSVPAIAAAGNMRFPQTTFNGGGQVGYNFRYSHFLLGFESDLGYITLTGTASATAVYPCCGPTAFTITQTYKTRGLFTARPRIGIVWGHMLIYATGGLAVTGVHYNETFTDTFATAAESGRINRYQVGYSAGGGIEYATSRHTSIKAEYLYNAFNSSTTSTNLTAFGPPVIGFPTNIFTHSVSIRAQAFRGGINFRF
jgi:outer membrane immunogenic protein